jgi:hypothetical protein
MEQVSFAAEICTPSENADVSNHASEIIDQQLEQKRTEQLLGTNIPSCRAPPGMAQLPE